MAIFTVKNMLTAGDFIRTTREYSSAQSLSRAGKNRHKDVLAIGRLRFVYALPDSVAQLHGIKSWDGFQVISGVEVPEGLRPLSRISKQIGVGESVMMGWALLNRMDVYWIGGHFAARQEDAQLIADKEKKRKAAFTIPHEKRKKRRSI